LVVTAAVAPVGALVLMWGGLVDYVTTGHTDLHWSRAVVAVFLLQVALIAGVVAVLRQVVALWKQQLRRDD
jgi:hypothetical protein